MEYAVTTFYKFMPLGPDKLVGLKEALEAKAAILGIFGLTLIAPEGVNATVSGSDKGIAAYKEFITGRFGNMNFKDSQADRQPFKRFKVKIKEEIVQLKRTDVVPSGQEPHVSPEEWDKLMEQDDIVLIDVRNWYEAKLGTFKKAINPKTWQFSNFPRWLQKADIPKEKKIGIFCTGGIRCEKAAVAMKEQGYEHVYQLDGGILNYIEQRPHRNFEGDCFVFDHRVAVGQNLKPSTRYGLCTSCGNGGWIGHVCEECGSGFKMCDDCAAAAPIALCSKNCRYHFERSKVDLTGNIV